MHRAPCTTPAKSGCTMRHVHTAVIITITIIVLLLSCLFRVELMDAADDHYVHIIIIRFTRRTWAYTCFFFLSFCCPSLAPHRRVELRLVSPENNRWTFFVSDAIIFGLRSCAPEFENRLPITTGEGGSSLRRR